MFTKRKYKIWKHLTKSLVAVPSFRQILSDALNVEINKAASCNDEKRIYDISTLSHIVCVQGYTYTGSSALIGFFNEFDNVMVVGNPETSWSKSSVSTPTSECRFFANSSFFDLLSAYESNASLEECDFCIKRFVCAVNSAYRQKKCWEWEYLPELYGENFRQITHDFLSAIIDMDSSTEELMKHREFPHTLSDHAYDDCSFVEGEGQGRYIFYRFKKIDKQQFANIVSRFVLDFFAIIGGKDYVVYDWLLPDDCLERLNHYMKHPIKQVCVIRDPRDRFISAFKSGCFLSPVAEDYCAEYTKLLDSSCSNEYRLVVRFEDLVLKYDETTRIIMNFLGMSQENHVRSREVFDPYLSVKNIGAWRAYTNRGLMDKMKSLLDAYCFEPEREMLSVEAVDLLRSSGNWNDVDFTKLI